MPDANHCTVQTGECIPDIDAAVYDSRDIAWQEEAYFQELEEQEDARVLKKSSHLWGIGYWKSVYDLDSDTATALENVQVLRQENLAGLETGEVLSLVRDPDNSRRLFVCKQDGTVLGRLPWTNCAAVIPLLENETIKALEVRAHSVQDGVLETAFQVAFQDLIRCTVYRVEYDGRTEELGVLRCVMALDAVKALFELHSGYRSNGIGYFGTYVLDAILAEPARYACLAEYEIDAYAHLEEILEQHSLPEEVYWRVDGSQVSEEDFLAIPSGCSRQKVLALFDGKRRMAHLGGARILESDGLVSRINLM